MPEGLPETAPGNRSVACRIKNLKDFRCASGGQVNNLGPVVRRALFNRSPLVR